MPDDNTDSLRLLIQQVGVSANPAYRVVVYGDGQRPCHSDFSGPQILLAALRAAIPEFDLSRLPLAPLEEGQGSMVFVGEMKLTKAQLSLLKLS